MHSLDIYTVCFASKCLNAKTGIWSMYEKRDYRGLIRTLKRRFLVTAPEFPCTPSICNRVRNSVYSNGYRIVRSIDSSTHAPEQQQSSLEHVWSRSRSRLWAQVIFLGHCRQRDSYLLDFTNITWTPTRAEMKLERKCRMACRVLIQGEKIARLRLWALVLNRFAGCQNTPGFNLGVIVALWWRDIVRLES